MDITLVMLEDIQAMLEVMTKHEFHDALEARR